AWPAGFRFSVKWAQGVSYGVGRRGAGPALARGLAAVRGLGSRPGGFLPALAPGLALDGRSAAAFFAMFRRRSGAPLACEPRHASWFTPQGEELFARHGVGRVGADPPRVPGGDLPLPSRHWRYWRWHGSPRIYYSEYDEAALRGLAKELRAAKGPGQRWVIFDNTAHGFAVANAARLRELLAPD